MKMVKIGNVYVGDKHPVFITAEIGGNFINFDEAKRLIDSACKTGVNAVKLQTFKAETITSKLAMYDMPNTGRVRQFDLFKKYEIDFNLHKEIWDYCREKNMFIFSTPSHIADVELLERLNCQTYKIGSDDAYNIPFLEEVASLGKPILLSTGMCTMAEVEESVSAIFKKGNTNLALLHCVTNYPADPKYVNLRAIQEMKNKFDLPIGYSDHTLGIICCLGAVALGANLVEKHFTYNKNAEGPDHMLSADFKEFKQLVHEIRILEKALGSGIKKPSESEGLTRINNRKSIIAAKDILKGTVITKDMIAIKRPGYGIQPKHINEIIGHITTKDIKSEEPLTWEYI